MPSPTSTKEIATSTMNHLKRLISGSSRDEDGEPKRYILSIERKNTPSTINSSLDDDVTRGFAVVRTIDELRALDVELRHYVTSSDGFPTFVTPTQSIQNFLQKVIETNQAVNSPALAKFLSIAEDPPKDIEDYTEPTLEYVKYLLPNIQTPTYEALPRFGSLQRKVDTFLPGWWLVWYLEVDDAPVDFTVFATGADGQLEQVHHEVVSRQETTTTTTTTTTTDSSSTSDQPTDQPTPTGASSVSGSYRIMSEPTRAMIQLKAQSVLHEQRIFLEYAAIPHDAFTAACAAANEANAVAQLRQTAPMLSRILEHSEPVTIVVQEYNKEEEDECKEQRRLMAKFDESANELDDSTCLSVAQLATLSDQVVSLEQSNAALQEERDVLQKELQQSQASVDDLTEKVQQADSERRVWTVVRQELNAELSRLSTGLQQARLYQEASVSELHDLRQELQESKGQVKLMELLGNADTTGGSSGQVEELVQVIRRLERDLQSEKDKSGEFQKSIQEVEKSAEARVTKAQEEAHQAKVEQRALESQLRQIKGSSRAKPPRMPKKRVFGLDPALANFKHPDPRLDEQLSTLRDRHAKLCTLMNQNPNGNAKNADIVAMLEKAIRDLVARGSSKAREEE